MNRTFVSRGHLIDTGILATILNTIIAEDADYQILKFQIGKSNLQTSYLELDVTCNTQEQLASLAKKLIQLGCYEKAYAEALLKEAPKDTCAPDDFYSTTNHRTEVFLAGKWQEVKNQRMDAVIVVGPRGAECRKLRDVKKGDRIVCNAESIRVFPPPRERLTDAFKFMSGEVSSERSVETMVFQLAEEIRNLKNKNGKIVAVAGPVVIHTGGGKAFAALLKEGYIHGVLSGNALAVHDIESVLFGTSLGVSLETGKTLNEGHRNHMRAINFVYSHGSIKAAVDQGAIARGIMYEIVKRNIPYCLAGSIRDDGPLPETVTDMIEAQRRYAEIVEDANMVIMLSSMLHSIGTGNMLPSWVKTVCVDINPAVVTKLSDRGSNQTVGIVSDVGLFLRALAQKLIGSF